MIPLGNKRVKTMIIPRISILAALVHGQEMRPVQMVSWC